MRIADVGRVRIVALAVRNRLAKFSDVIVPSFLGRQSVQISDMRCQRRLNTVGHRDGRFLVSAAGQQRLQNWFGERLIPERQRKWSDSPCRANADRPVRDHSHDTIINRPMDFAIMIQEQIGNSHQPVLGIVDMVCQWFAVQISAGANQRQANTFQQQIMQGRRRQHQTNVGQSRIDLWCNCRRRSLSNQHNRIHRRTQLHLFRGTRISQVADVGKCSTKHRERLRRSSLESPQAIHGAGRCGINQKLIAPHAAHRHNPTAAQTVGGGIQRLAAANVQKFMAIAGPQERPTMGTRNRLRMKPPIEWIVVFPLTIVTHLERPHRRPFAIKRHAEQHAVTRAAVGTRRERIAKPSIVRIASFLQTIVAN